MNASEYLERFSKVCESMITITRLKSHDYSGTEEVFRNFRLIEHLTGGAVSLETGILTRMTDKLSRVAQLLSHSTAVGDERIQDTLLDLAVYAVILHIYMTAKAEGKSDE